ncbi:MAG: hypothetical protein U9Q76_05890 [candidate division WOR-3 bacterium]|nr:hypothetical protein [candidate division WOR-3 bacterium]
MEIRNESHYRKVSGAVSKTGYIRLSSLGHAYSLLTELGMKITFKVDDTRSLTGKPAGIDAKYFLAPEGAPRKNIVIDFTPQYDIYKEKPDERKEMFIRLRKAIWHEVMELALITINTWVFNNPEDTSKIGLANAFAHKHVKNQENSGFFFPWTGDKISSPGQGAKKLALSLPRGPIKEFKITCAARLTGTIKDYKGMVVEKLDVPPGKTFVWGPKAEPGEYWLDAVFGYQVIKNQRLELLPGKSLSLKAEFKRDQFGDLHIVTEYKNWPRNKKMRVRIVNSSDSELYSEETEKADGKIVWGKSFGFKREGYKVEAYVRGSGDRFLADLLKKGELVKPKEIKLDFGSRWEVEFPKGKIRIRYRDWHGYFVCMIFDPSGKKVGEFRKSDKSGNIEWGGSTHIDAGLYFVKAILDKGVHEIKKAILLK